MFESFMGKIEKMKIQAYTDATFNSKSGEPLTVQINPENYTRQLKIIHCENQTPGSTGADLAFVRINPEELHFDFLFDSTGVIKETSLLPTIINPFAEINDVVSEVEAFVSGIYDSTIHRSKYLEILWGTLAFKCVLTALDIEYKLFKPDGKPIRALAKGTFKEFKPQKQRLAEENRQSPDITHRRTFKESDRFTLLAEKIYTSDKYYIDAAKANNLTSFRKIRTGSDLYFPPVK
ncbi:LysM peptidoglycan-binding domain-containing protein [Dyadobacter sp. NIV53]|uniref:CIS tube protein n=1 Tax=Dyadobacter sp. NIV53 TaxID=2861765 RepID=UPI001C874952|nr:LysM peptidoglycan-binding domain-containing protein [Dyadobacter sp. NIV53]